jgi:HD-like signal output (HDOD) protein
MRHVMVVDDDSSVLSGIRRLMYTMRTKWRMTFVCDGAAAVEVFGSDPPDVVVSDMRMPGMDGAELLAAARRQCPGAVRMILSGHADRGAALRSVGVAHRFLSKPCDAQTLLTSVSDACQLQDRLDRPELRRLVGGLGGLPSPPESSAAIAEALARPDVSERAVVIVIERDPSFAVKLVQLANSAFFGLARSTADIAEAVAHLGLDSIRDVVCAVEAAGLFKCESLDTARVAYEVRARSHAVATAAREYVPEQHAQVAFAAGLLHDIGRLAFVAIAPQHALAVEEDERRGVDLASAERKYFGATHAEVSGYLIRLWGLPSSLLSPVVRHHDPDARSDPDLLVAAVARAVAEVEGGDD